MIWLQRIIPQHYLSKLMSSLTRIENIWFKNILINWFARHYQVDLSLANRQRAEDYKHFNDFFTRSLKSSSINIANSDILSPVDGVVSQLGDIKNSKILQVKNHSYSLEQLLLGSAVNFENGFFVTIYLSPRDYHRIHMPFDGDLQKMCYIPGRLFAVNQKTANNVNNLFAKNERVVCYFKTKFGLCALILVGAIFVGSMQTVWHGKISSKGNKKRQNFTYKDKTISLKKGEELGRFNMGSTVIMLIPRCDKTLSLTLDEIVKVGQSIVV